MTTSPCSDARRTRPASWACHSRSRVPVAKAVTGPVAPLEMTSLSLNTRSRLRATLRSMIRVWPRNRLEPICASAALTHGKDDKAAITAIQ